MPSKYKIIMEMASQTARDVTSNVERYSDCVDTSKFRCSNEKKKDKNEVSA